MGYGSMKYGSGMGAWKNGNGSMGYESMKLWRYGVWVYGNME